MSTYCCLAFHPPSWPPRCFLPWELAACNIILRPFSSLQYHPAFLIDIRLFPYGFLHLFTITTYQFIYQLVLFILLPSTFLLFQHTHNMPAVIHSIVLLSVSQLLSHFTFACIKSACVVLSSLAASLLSAHSFSASLIAENQYGFSSIVPGPSRL